MMSQSSNSSQSISSTQQKSPQAETFKWSEINLQETFQLIDSLIPSEVCLKYQILPLTIVQKHLILGIINSKDRNTLDYVHSLIDPLNYSLKLRQIDSKNHQLIISAYINHRQVIEVGKPLVSQQYSATENLHEKPTLIIDDPEALQEEIAQLNEDSSVIFQISEPSQILPSQSPLELEQKSANVSLESLANLSPIKLWQALFTLLLNKGIGRLYFERHNNYGRIIWTQNGAIQSSIDKLDSKVFQSIIDELKKLVQLPNLPLQKPKKIELEKCYQQKPFLFRVQLKPGKYGEEGNLQILHGDALKFYQQQQMDILEDQAIDLAKQLERKLRQIDARSRMSAIPVSKLNELRPITNHIYQQFKVLEKSNDTKSG
jgi:hypothetical protein